MKEDIKKAIVSAISTSLTELGVLAAQGETSTAAAVKTALEINTKVNAETGVPKITLERPADMSHGDFATNAALVYAPKAKKKPLEFAIEILEHLKKQKEAKTAARESGGLADIEKIEIAGPGFINFYISEKSNRVSISEILQNETSQKNYGVGIVEAGKKIIFDYTDPNPFKVFHIGHLMTNIIGESFARIAEAQGADVKRFCYQGDVGRHVALTIWGLRFMPKGVDGMMPADSATLTEKVSYFGKAYSLGATEYKRLEDEAGLTGNVDERDRPTSPEFAVADAEVRKLNKEIYERSNEEVNIIYDKGREWSLEHFEELYNILGTKFDQYFFESQTTPVGLKIVNENTAPDGRAIFEKSNGAVIFPGEKYGLHTRVFVTTDGLPTYEGKDMGLVIKKREACEFDKSIIMTGNEQDDYFKVVYKATELLFPELAGKSSHISHGMMRFASGKMSSRTGNVVSGESLLMDIIALAHEKMKDRDMTAEEKGVVAKQVGVAALKYSMLRQATGKDIIFDQEKSLSFEGDSGPYLQYSCVRARAVLNKANKEGVDAKVFVAADGISSDDAAETDSAAIELGDAGIKFEKLLVRFPETVERAWLERAPHHVATYLMELAATFNSFYAATQIVKANDNSSSAHKVALTKAFTVIMKNGLNFLGIVVPNKM